jgi:hypothetical protein
MKEISVRSLVASLMTLVGLYGSLASAVCYVGIPNYCFYDPNFSYYSGYDYWSSTAQSNMGVCLDRANQFNAYCGLGGNLQVNQTYPFVPVTATFCSNYIGFLCESWTSYMGPVPSQFYGHD